MRVRIAVRCLLLAPLSVAAQGRTVSLPARAVAARVETRTLVEADALDAASVRALVVDRLGAIYVADARDMRILAFDSTGRHMRSFGARGAGPGEFRAIDDIAIARDTLFVLDGVQRRLSLFSHDGKLITTRPWPGALRQGKLIGGSTTLRKV